MAAQKGRDLLVRIAAVPGEDPPTAYNTVAGLRARSIRFNADLVDATTAESPQAWRELLEGAGLKRVDVRGDGLFVDAASDLRLREAFFNQETAAFELVAPDFGVMTGRFIVSQLAYAGAHHGEATFSITLASAGEITFSATN